MVWCLLFLASHFNLFFFSLLDLLITNLYSAQFFRSSFFKGPVLPIEHCTLRSLGEHFSDVENSEAFVCDQSRTL